MSDEWYYAKNNQQFGPISAAQLNELVESGQLSADDLVWKDGMTHWQAVSRARHLFEGAAAQAQAARGPASNAPSVPHPAAVQGRPYGQQGAIGYYSVTADISARTLHILRGFPAPTGPRGDWPLSDAHLAQLALAEKHRKAIRAFNSLCQFFTLLLVLGAIFVTFGLLVGAWGGPRAMRSRVVALSGMGLMFLLAIAALYYFCGRAALKCRIWGPITVCVLLTVGILYNLVTSLIMINQPFGAGPGMGVIFFTLLMGSAFLWMTIRSMIAIPRFLNSPVWAQEALVNAKL